MYKEESMNEYPKWVHGVTPGTNYKARVIRTRHVNSVSAIEVTGGKYRGATLNGVFEVADGAAKLPGRILVRCAWFGVTPQTTYPQLDVSLATLKKLANYSGPVADNIGT
jgi:hypothetical protein